MINLIFSIFSSILLGAGMLFFLYWQIRFMVVTYRYSLGWFWACLFVPGADLAFLLLYFKLSRKPYDLSLLGLLVAALGGLLTKIVWQG